MLMKNMNLSAKVLNHQIITEVSLFLTECEKTPKKLGFLHEHRVRCNLPFVTKHKNSARDLII